MTVELHFRDEKRTDQGMETVRAVFNTLEEALAQAARDEAIGTRLPEAVYDEGGKKLVGRTEIRQAARELES